MKKSKKLKVKDREIPVLDWIPSPGQVVLTYEDQYEIDKYGWEKPNAKKNVKTAVVVAHGEDDGFSMNPAIRVGARVVMPFVRKQAFEVDGHKFFLVHHLDIKLIDPIEDIETMAAILKHQIHRMPKDVKSELEQYLLSLPEKQESNVK